VPVLVLEPSEVQDRELGRRRRRPLTVASWRGPERGAEAITALRSPGADRLARHPPGRARFAQRTPRLGIELGEL
jgi:hypothetical protein